MNSIKVLEPRMYGIEAEKLPESSFMNYDNKEEASDCILRHL